MAIVEYRFDRDSLYIGGSHEDSQKKSVMHSVGLPNLSSENLWNFVRTGSNHSYMCGNVMRTRGDCSNNIIFSTSKEVVLENVSNSFVYVLGDQVLTKPISEINDNANIIAQSFRPGGILYQRPERVQRRENLRRKNIDSIQEIIEFRYGLMINKMTPIPSRSKNEGIYSVVDKSGAKYIFKYLSSNQRKAELISKIVSQFPSIFPSIFPRRDEPLFTTRLVDGYYSLESFVDGDCRPKTLGYFDDLGHGLSNLHNMLSSVSLDQSEKEALNHLGSCNEGTMLSVYTDFLQHSQLASLSSRLEGMFENGTLSSQTRQLPRQLVHGDLNGSNILWTDKGIRFIDIESLGISNLGEELVPALILNGNREQPAYLHGSIETLLKSCGGNSPIQEGLLKEHVKYSLMRYFGVRTIRRDLGDISEKNELEKMLRGIS